MVWDAWTHVAITVASGGTVTFYVNGSSVDTDTVAGISQATTQHLIGALSNSTGSPTAYTTGTLSDVALYDTELSGARILAHYNAA
jgi:hypothetical protein